MGNGHGAVDVAEQCARDDLYLGRDTTIDRRCVEHLERVTRAQRVPERVEHRVYPARRRAVHWCTLAQYSSRMQQFPVPLEQQRVRLRKRGPRSAQRCRALEVLVRFFRIAEPGIDSRHARVDYRVVRVDLRCREGLL